MIGLVEPLRDVQYPEQGVSSVMKENRSSLLGFVSRDGIADLMANVITLVLPALGTMIGMIAFLNSSLSCNQTQRILLHTSPWFFTKSRWH